MSSPTWPPTPAPLAAVTYASFIVDYPEFSNAATYPEAAFTLFANEAATMMNVGRWGAMYNDGYELFVAHKLMLYKRRQDTAALNAYPGLGKGVLNSESPGQVSLSYDTTASTEERGGMYNETEYGREFLRKARLVGMGAVQVNHGNPAGAVGQVQSFMAWPGPPTGNGYSF
jgi:hypothetical protein